MTECVFCEMAMQTSDNDHFGTVFAVLDGFPVTRLHWLVIPIRHCEDYFVLTPEEKGDTDIALSTLRRRVMDLDSNVSGFNLGWNCGTTAGQTVMHAHAHLIPRRFGDMPDPRGGVRGVVPGKQNYAAAMRLTPAAV